MAHVAVAPVEAQSPGARQNAHGHPPFLDFTQGVPTCRGLAAEAVKKIACAQQEGLFATARKGAFQMIGRVVQKQPFYTGLGNCRAMGRLVCNKQEGLFADERKGALQCTGRAHCNR